MKKLAALLLAFTMLFSFATFAEESEYKHSFTVDYMDMIIEFIAENYKFGITEGELYEIVLKQMLDENPQLFEEILTKAFGSLDKHSEFLNYEEMQNMMSSILNVLMEDVEYTFSESFADIDPVKLFA